VEIKAIDPPKSVKDAMEKQMRAEREKRAAILTAEGARQSQILTAEGDKTSKILRAEGDKQAAILRAEGEAQAISQVFGSIHRNDPDPKLLAYQYLQTLPQLAAGAGNTFWVIPSEVTTALKAVTSAFGGGDAAAPGTQAAGAASPAAAEQAAPPAIPRQPGLPEIAAQQGQLTAQPAPDAEVATDPVPAAPASITPPGSLNGSAPSSGEDG
jgi:regulator of protease activity HflC (stomatin/prohibitin superfamily)